MPKLAILAPLIAGLYRQLYQATPIVREGTSYHEKVKEAS
jgi:hypothetical protein